MRLQAHFRSPRTEGSVPQMSAVEIEEHRTATTLPFPGRHGESLRSARQSVRARRPPRVAQDLELGERLA